MQNRRRTGIITREEAEDRAKEREEIRGRLAKTNLALIKQHQERKELIKAPAQKSVESRGLTADRAKLQGQFDDLGQRLNKLHSNLDEQFHKSPALQRIEKRRKVLDEIKKELG